MRYKLVVTQIEHIPDPLENVVHRNVRDIIATDLPTNINIEDFIKKLSKLIWEGK